MPSVGMRRSTRVLGARVLRSGRRLWTEPHQSAGKHVRASNVDNKWIHDLDDSADGGEDAGDDDDICKDAWPENENENEDDAMVDIVVEPSLEERASEGNMEVKNVDKMWGIVYQRKRKRKSADLVSSVECLPEDKMYGKKFVRKKWRTSGRATESLTLQATVSESQVLFIVVNDSFKGCGHWTAAFLTTILSYMSRVRIGLRLLSKFLLSGPIFDAYSSHGVLFLQDCSRVTGPGFCIISGRNSMTPLFSLDFSVIPFSFVVMHTSMSLRSVYMSCLLMAHLIDPDEKNEDVTDMAHDYEEPSLQIPFGGGDPEIASLPTECSPSRETSQDNLVASGSDNSQRMVLSHRANASPKTALRNIKLRNSRNIQKRRSSLRRKRGRPPQRVSSGTTLASDFLRLRDDSVKASAATTPSSRVLRSMTATSIREINPDVRAASSCSANLLVIEEDKCYREEGATITLEQSSSSSNHQWFLTVVKDGVKRCSVTAQKAMRPSCSNRFTHATVWAGDAGWKLEFLKKQDWLIFKELYKQCSEHNIQHAPAPAAAASVIPVPGVQEVVSDDDNYYVPYVRPDSYITVKYDELTRALARKTANYDIDSDDEEWLANFNSNNVLCGESSAITVDTFELIVDALEKGLHGNPDEHFDEQAGYDSCIHILGTREVIDAIRNYWIKKRKVKRSALVRIFQLYQPRRSLVIPKSVLRKKRSFKRKATQGGRGKSRTFLQAMTAERNTLQQQNNAQKLQSAKAAADRLEALAIQKRQRAQMLMENADLATYKALMALRIADVAQIVEAPDKVALLLNH